MPRELERHLVVELIPAEMLASALSGEEPARLPLDQDVIAEYSEWDLSHTLSTFATTVQQYSRSYLRLEHDAQGR